MLTRGPKGISKGLHLTFVFRLYSYKKCCNHVHVTQQFTCVKSEILCFICGWYRKTSSISRTKFQNLNVSCILMQLSWLNSLKPGVKLIMKMLLEQRRQAMLQLHLSYQQFYCLLRCDLYERFYGSSRVKCVGGVELQFHLLLYNQIDCPGRHWIQ